MSIFGWLIFIWVITSIVNGVKKKSLKFERERLGKRGYGVPSGELAEARQNLYVLEQARGSLENDELKGPVDDIIRMTQRVLYTAEKEPVHRGKTSEFLGRLLPSLTDLIARVENQGLDAAGEGAKQLKALSASLGKQVRSFYSGKIMNLAEPTQMVAKIGALLPGVHSGTGVNLARAHAQIDRLDAFAKDTKMGPVAQPFSDMVALSRYIADTSGQYPQVMAKCWAFFSAYLPNLVSLVEGIALASDGAVVDLTEAFALLDKRLREKIEAMRTGTPLEFSADLTIMETMRQKIDIQEPASARARAEAPQTSRIERARQLCVQLAAVQEKIVKPSMRAHVMELAHLSARVLECAERDPKSMSGTQAFFSDYLPALLALLERYGVIEQNKIDNGDFIAMVEKLMQRLSRRFSSYLQAIYSDQPIEVAEDVRLLRAALSGESADDAPSVLRRTSGVAVERARKDLAEMAASVAKITKRRMKEGLNDLIALCEKTVALIERSPGMQEKASEFFSEYIPKLLSLVTRYELFQDRRMGQPMGQFAADAEEALFALQRSFATRMRTESGLPDFAGDVALLNDVLDGVMTLEDSSWVSQFVKRRRAIFRNTWALGAAALTGAAVFAGVFMWSALPVLLDVAAGFIGASCGFMLTRLVTGARAQRELVSADPDGRSEEIARASNTLSRLSSFTSLIDNKDITEPLKNIVSTLHSILETIEKNPSKYESARGFLERYLPTLIGILDRYNVMEDKGLAHHGSEFRAQVEGFMPEFERAFAKQLQALYKDDVLDASLDIDVLQSTLRAEGLLDAFGPQMGRQSD